MHFGKLWHKCGCHVLAFCGKAWVFAIPQLYWCRCSLCWIPLCFSLSFSTSLSLLLLSRFRTHEGPARYAFFSRFVFVLSSLSIDLLCWFCCVCVCVCVCVREGRGEGVTDSKVMLYYVDLMCVCVSKIWEPRSSQTLKGKREQHRKEVRRSTSSCVIVVCVCVCVCVCVSVYVSVCLLHIVLIIHFIPSYVVFFIYISLIQ